MNVRSDEECLRTRIRWLLAAAVAVVYWRVSLCGFINYDDEAFVVGNSHVYSGLSPGNMLWAVSTLNGGTAYYQPVTWLSHQLDCQLFGLQAGAQHMTNLWLHVINTVLLFTLLDTLIRRPWRSAMVAALFALHPLHVETVAWISERKSLVCVFFWLLTTLAYIRYVRRGGVARYVLVLLLYAAALLSKPLAVSLPLTLILLDYWPLNRIGVSPGELVNRDGVRAALAGTPGELEGGKGVLVAPGCYPVGLFAPLRQFLFGRPMLEKLPLFILSGLGCLITVLAQADLGATKSLQEVPMEVRLNNGIVACVLYLRKVFWPADLAPIYPLRHDWAWWQVAGCGLLLLSLSFWVVREARRRRYLLVGWAWYLVTLFPTLGLVQVGSQGMADRYTYVPLLGIFLLFVWLASELIASAGMPRLVAGVGAAGLVGVCAISTFVTTQYWQDSFRLFQHALQVTGDNYIAYRQLGLAFNIAGDFHEAAKYFRKSLSIEPKQAFTEMFLGEALSHEGDSQGGFEHYSLALKLKPGDAQVHSRLAELFIYSKDPRFHDLQKAVEQARLACELSHYRKPGLVAVLADTYAQNGQFHEAADEAQKVLALSVGPKEIEGARKLMEKIKQMATAKKDGIALRMSEAK